MAIVQGDLVTPKVVSTGTPIGTYGPVFTPQPIRIGVVDNAPGDIDVLWHESGSLVTGIDTSVLDVLDPPDSNELARLQGKVVRTVDDAEWSPEYQGIVVSMYRRDPAGAGTPDATVALVKLQSGVYMEIPSAQLVVAGR